MMRRALLIAGTLVLAVAWIGPLPELAGGAFWAHMALHMTIVAVAAPLLALGVAGGRFDPAVRWPGPFHPIAASVVELIIVWAWHAPGLHHFARASATGLVLEQGTFLLAGLLLWVSAVGGRTRDGLRTVNGSTGDEGPVTVDGPPGVGRPAMVDGWTVGGRGASSGRFGGVGESRKRAAAGVVGLLLTAMHMTLLGALLALATRPLFHASSVEVAGMTALQDQHLGGAIMILVGGVTYLAGGLYLTVGLLRQSDLRGGSAQRGEGSGRRSGDDVSLVRQSISRVEGAS